MIKVQVSADLLTSWNKTGSVIDAFRVKDGLPADAVLIKAEVEDHNLSLYFASASSPAEDVQPLTVWYERVGELIKEAAPLDAFGERTGEAAPKKKKLSEGAGS